MASARPPLPALAKVERLPERAPEPLGDAALSGRRRRPAPRHSHHGCATLAMNVPQFASVVRGAFGMYSVANQMLPLSSATAAE